MKACKIHLLCCITKGFHRNSWDFKLCHAITFSACQLHTNNESSDPSCIIYYDKSYIQDIQKS